MEQELLYTPACLYLKFLASNLELFQVEETHMDISCQEWYAALMHMAKCPWSSFALFTSGPEPPQGYTASPASCPWLFLALQQMSAPNRCQQLCPPLPSTPFHSHCPCKNLSKCLSTVADISSPSGSPNLPFHLSNAWSTSLSATQVQLDSPSAMPDDQQKAPWVRKADGKLRPLE